MTYRLLCISVVIAGCGAPAREVIVRSPEPTSAAYSASQLSVATVRADPFTGNGAGVRRIDAAIQ
ncbi:MAG: hypothetical protein ACOY0T_10890 [Myxococcota bacterium]